MKYVEIFFECIATYFYLVFLLRYLGKKEMSKLSVSDLIVFLLISELMTISIGDDNVNFFHGALAAFVIIILDKLCSYFSMKYKPIKKILEGHPSFIVVQGKLNKEKMKALNYSVDDLCHHLREQGIGSLSEVDFAVLETDGALSVIEMNKSQVEMPESLINDGEINYEILKVMNRDEAWLKKQLHRHGVSDYRDVFYCIMEKDRLFYIKK